MFEIQSGAKTKFKYEVQGLFTKDMIYQSLIIKTSWAKTYLDRRHKCLMNIEKRKVPKH